MDEILFALWFFLPAGLANGAPVIANKIPLLNQFKTPLDFGLHFRDKRVLGDNKTWRGLLSGIFVGIVVVLMQSFIYDNWSFVRSMSSVDYSVPDIWVLGGLLGLGALAGDAIESFIKRQMNIPSGERWFPFDQLDYVIGGLLLSALYAPLVLQEYVVIIIIWFGMHILWAYVFYVLGFKEKPI